VVGRAHADSPPQIFINTSNYGGIVPLGKKRLAVQIGSYLGQEGRFQHMLALCFKTSSKPLKTTIKQEV